jgi:hypothetical protein
MARRRALRLSTRVTLFFATTALLGGIGLTVTTYLFARNSLLDQRTVSAEAAATDNALDVNRVLDEDRRTIEEAVIDLDTDPDGWAASRLLTFPTSWSRPSSVDSPAGSISATRTAIRGSASGLRFAATTPSTSRRSRSIRPSAHCGFWRRR